MLKTILAIALLPSLAFARGPFEINYGTYKVISRRAKESIEPGDISKGIAYLEIFEKTGKKGRAIVLKLMDDDRELRGGGWFTTAMVPLSDGRYVMSEFSGGETRSEVIWELERG